MAIAEVSLLAVLALYHLCVTEDFLSRIPDSNHPGDKINQQIQHIKKLSNDTSQY